MMRVFRDRREAGACLAHELARFGGEDPIVLALPRGGVPVAYEVARGLGAPLDVILVRKLGVPSQPELAMGAVGEGDALVVNEQVVDVASISRAELALVAARERGVIEARARQYRGSRSALDLTGRTVIVVDDGIATGSTARAALQVARARGAVRVILGAPVAPSETIVALASPDERLADEVVCLETPRRFFAVGQWYENFTQVSDDEVSELLARAGLSQKEDTMRAAVGDRLVIKGHYVGEPDRDAEILEVRGAGGSPPYRVRWEEDGHEGLFYPGSDAVVEHFPRSASKR